MFVTSKQMTPFPPLPSPPLPSTLPRTSMAASTRTYIATDLASRSQTLRRESIWLRETTTNLPLTEKLATKKQDQRSLASGCTAVTTMRGVRHERNLVHCRQKSNLKSRNPIEIPSYFVW